MSPVLSVLAASEQVAGLSPFIPAGIAFIAFLLLGVVVWSYRDVANRQAKKASDQADDTHDAHGSGH
jgi:hypothetical protein